MIQSISQVQQNNIFNKHQSIAPKIKAEPMHDSVLNRDVEIVNYLQETQKQNNTKNKLLMGCIASIAIGSLLVTYAITQKGTGRSSLYHYGKGMANDFKSLEKEVNIPTLDSCKSLNKKMRTFLKNQVNYTHASNSDITKTGMPKPASKLLLYGPPGTGKSFFAKIFAKTINAEYAEVKFSDFNSVWSGEHIENLKNVFEGIISKAQAQPKKKFVVTFNEIDSIVQPAEGLMRAGCGHSFFKLEERSTFLNYIDEISEKAPNIIIIGTTNVSPKNKGLDGAAMSRFKNIMEVNYPEKDCLFEALKAHLEKIDNGKTFVDKNKSKLEKFAQDLEARQCSFRDLDSIIDYSKNYYLDDFMKNKNSKFKFEYLEQAKSNINLTDGEINASL